MVAAVSIFRSFLGLAACMALTSGAIPACVIGAAYGHWVPRADMLQPWTTKLRDQQPKDAFAAVYRLGRQRLVFVGAVHANRVDSLTFRAIRDAFARFQIDTVIAEGFPTARGPNPLSIFKYVSENGPDKDGFVEAGELVPAALGARTEGATLWGGEAQDVDVKARVLAQGVSSSDLLGFYVLRNIPQWISERQLKSAADPKLQTLAEQALTQSRERLQLPPNVLPNFERWADWYNATNGKPLDASFTTEEVGPLA